MFYSAIFYGATAGALLLTIYYFACNYYGVDTDKGGSLFDKIAERRHKKHIFEGDSSYAKQLSNYHCALIEDNRAANIVARAVEAIYSSSVNGKKAIILEIAFDSDTNMDKLVADVECAKEFFENKAYYAKVINKDSSLSLLIAWD